MVPICHVIGGNNRKDDICNDRNRMRDNKER